MENSVDKHLLEYKKLKDELLNIDKSTTEDQDFLNLVTNNNIEPDLRNLLILLHSNYKTELKDLKSLSYKILYRLVDENHIVLNKMNDEIKILKKENELLKSTEEQGVLKMKNMKHIVRGILTLLAVIVSLFFMAVINPDAYNLVLESIKDILSFTGVGNENKPN